MPTGLVAALRFLTRIRVPGPETRPEHLGRAVAWFPLVGALVGLATAAVHRLGLEWWPGPVAGVVAVAFGLMLTGGFHEDGASDAADGLGAGGSPERVVRIMRDSRLGAYGAMALWVLLALRWAALVALGPRSLVALPLAMAWGRWSMALILTALPPAAQGLGSRVRQDLGRGPLALATLLAGLVTAAAWAMGQRQVWPPAAAAALAALAWTWYLKRRMGGQTGDLLGAGNQLAEAAALLVLVAR